MRGAILTVAIRTDLGVEAAFDPPQAPEERAAERS